MGAYLTIEENITDMLKELCNDETIQKLLVNSTKTALTDSLPIDFNKFSLLDTQVFDIPKMINPETKATSVVLAYLMDSKFSSNSINQYDMVVEVCVICHNDIWQLKNGAKRPYRIIDRVDTLLKNTKTNSIRGNWIPLAPFKFSKFNDSFNGYYSRWGVTNSNRVCN